MKFKLLCKQCGYSRVSSTDSMVDCSKCEGLLDVVNIWVETEDEAPRVEELQGLYGIE